MEINLNNFKIETEEEERARFEAEKAVKIKEMNEIQVAMGIGKRYWGCKIAQFPNTTPVPAVDLAEAFANGESLLMLGTNGVGKSSLAMAIVNNLKFKKKLNGIKILNDYEIRTLVKKMNDDRGYNPYQEYGKCNYLVLDDVGVVSKVGIVIEILTGILMERYNQMLPTIITGNKDLLGIFDVSISSRITQTFIQVETGYKNDMRLI